MPGRSTDTTVSLNGWQVTVDAAAGTWQVLPPGGSTPVLSGPGGLIDDDGDTLSTVRVATGDPFVLRAFGAFHIELESAKSGMTWTPVSSAAATVSMTSGSITLTWSAADAVLGTVSLRFATYGSRDLEVQLLSSTDGVSGGEIAATIGDDEAFFGLGTQVAGLDLRGHTFPLWTQEGGIGKTEGNGLYPLTNTLEAAYAPMGIWHSSAGYSALLTTDTYAEVDLGEAHGDRLELRTYGALPGFVLLAGDTPKDRLTALSDYVGRISEPPPWLLAPWNTAFGGPDRLWQVASELRDNHIPTSAIWSEDWIGLERNGLGPCLSYAWEWDPERYPSLPEDIQLLHDQGFAFLGYFNTFVPHGEPQWSEGLAGQYLIHRDRGSNFLFFDPGFRVSSMVDLTNPEARAWMKEYLIAAIQDVGLDGWMADFAEWLPSDARLENGDDGWAQHNLYPLQWQQLNREAMEEAHANDPRGANNWTFFARSGWASTSGGTASLAPSLWGGDQNTNWGYHDGFPSAVAIGAHVGLGGVAVYGSDIAGYTHVLSPPTTKELYLRWSEFGAFSPLMRTHHGQDACSNWDFDRDQETLEHFKRYAIVHTLLYPYLKGLIDEAMDAGLPLLRHPFLVEPDRSGLWTDKDYEYFLGDDLLVAPVLEEGATTRMVRLPAPGWWPLFGVGPMTTGWPAEGEVWEDQVDVPVTEIPVFVRPGTVLTLLGTAVDSFYGATSPGMTDLSDVAGYYTLALYPDDAGALAGTTAGTAFVSGYGWTDLTPDWSAALVNGQPLPVCDGSVTVSCVDAAGDEVLLVGSGLELIVGGARLTVTSSQAQRYRVAIGGAAWGDQSSPTTVSDLHPDVPPPCE